MSQLHILIVEDDADGADLVEMMLNAANVATTVARHGEDALEIMTQGERFDAAIHDLALPGMDCFELLSYIREMPARTNLPTVAITAFHTPELKVKALDAGFDGYFAKPLDTNIFVGALERILFPQ
jgi:CheY-like chemotaxis protein